MWRSSLHIGWRHARLPVAVGAIAIFLNRYSSDDSAGPLAANLIGCYIVGMAIACFTAYPTIAPEWRLFVTTGFCGGLTTFSTFSAETVMLLQSGRAIGRSAPWRRICWFFVDDVRRHRHRHLAQGLGACPTNDAPAAALRGAVPAPRKPWVAFHGHPCDACVAPPQRHLLPILSLT